MKMNNQNICRVTYNAQHCVHALWHKVVPIMKHQLLIPYYRLHRSIEHFALFLGSTWDAILTCKTRSRIKQRVSKCSNCLGEKNPCHLLYQNQCFHAGGKIVLAGYWMGKMSSLKILYYAVKIVICSKQPDDKKVMR